MIISAVLFGIPQAYPLPRVSLHGTRAWMQARVGGARRLHPVGQGRRRTFVTLRRPPSPKRCTAWRSSTRRRRSVTRRRRPSASSTTVSPQASPTTAEPTLFAGSGRCRWHFGRLRRGKSGIFPRWIGPSGGPSTVHLQLVRRERTDPQADVRRIAMDSRWILYPPLSALDNALLRTIIRTRSSEASSSVSLDYIPKNNR